MPTESNPVVLLFEDDPNIVKAFTKLVMPKLGKDIGFVVFPLNEPPISGNKPYEDRVVEWIRASGFYDRLALVVTDRDLSANSDDWSGLSQTAVSGAAKLLGLPVAGYRRNKPNAIDEFKRIPGDGLIDLAPEVGKRADQVAILAKGFIELQARMQRHEGADVGGPGADGAKKRRPAGAALAASPGVLLAGVLHQPAAAAHFDTFACGDQVAIGEILAFSQDRKAKMSAQVQRRLVSALGVWLTDLVMKYPGVLVNEVAAASYLDIAPDDFKRADVQKLFKGALYTNLPFEDKATPLWWRHLLDDIVSEGGASSGLDLCGKKGLKKVTYCPCSVDPKLHAGYYCMATFEPISAEKSSGRLRWFPPGADLARLKASIYRKLSPWIG